MKLERIMYNPQRPISITAMRRRVMILIPKRKCLQEGARRKVVVWMLGRGKESQGQLHIHVIAAGGTHHNQLDWLAALAATMFVD